MRQIKMDKLNSKHECFLTIQSWRIEIKARDEAARLNDQRSPLQVCCQQ